MNDNMRMRFIKTLNGLDESGRLHLLRLETCNELAVLFELAFLGGYTGVAASIEVAANSTGDY